MKYPKQLEDLISMFEKLPTIGRKSAERLAFYILFNFKEEDINVLSQCLNNIKNDIKICKNCGVICEEEECSICKDATRENILLIVESVKDVLVFERTLKYHGLYHVLNGLISIDDDEKLAILENRVKKLGVEEIILALPSSLKGDLTKHYIKKVLEDKEVYSIAYGVPVGASIEYVDDITILKSLEGKRKI